MVFNNKVSNLNAYSVSIFTKLSIVLIGFLITVIQARYLGSEIKGQVAYIFNVASPISILMGFGIHQAYPYYRKKDCDVLPVFMMVALAIYFLYSLMCFPFFFLTRLSKNSVIFILIPIMVYCRIISYISMVENPNKKNLIELLINFVELGFVTILFCFFTPSFYMGVSILLLKDLLMAFIYTYHLRNKISKIEFSTLFGWIRRLIRFGFLPMLALLMTTLNYRLDIIMLGGRVSDASIGVYSIGVMFAERLWMIPDAMKEVMVSKLAKGKDIDEVCLVMRICNTVCLLVIVIMIIFGKPFIYIAFGNEYRGSYNIALVLLLGIVPMVYYKLIASYYITIRKQRLNFIFLSISVITNIIANLFLIPALGILGAAVATVLSYGICSLLFVQSFHLLEKIEYKKMFLISQSDISLIIHKGSKQ